MSQPGGPNKDDSPPQEKSEPQPSTGSRTDPTIAHGSPPAARTDRSTGSPASLRSAPTVGTDRSMESETSHGTRRSRLTATSETNVRKSILIIHDSYQSIPPVEENTSKRSLELVYSQDTGAYKFFKRFSKDSTPGNMSKTEAFIYMVIPPDKGYAWFILAMAFCCQSIVDGILLSVGTLLPSIASDLSLNSTQSILIASTQIGLYYLSAPIGSAFINRYGFRPVALTGALVASFATFLGSFSNSLTSLVCTYGLLVGPALGMIGVCSVLIVNYYFERYRAIVGGIVSSAMGLGIIVMSVCNMTLVDKVGWRFVFRVHMALLIIVGLITTTYKEVEPTKIGYYIEYISEESDDNQSVSQSVEIQSVNYTQYLASTSNISVHDSTSSLRNIEKRISSYHRTKSTWRHYASRVCPCCIRKSQPIPSEGRMYVIDHDILDRADIFYNGSPDYSKIAIKDVSKSQDVYIKTGRRARSVNYTLSMIVEPPDQPRKKFSYLPDKIANAFHALFDMQLLHLAEFRLLLAIAFISHLGFNVPFVFTTVRAEIDAKYTEALPVTIGVTNIILRVSMGFVAYKVKFHPAYLSGCGVTLGGLVTLISGFHGEDSVPFQFFFVLCFGIATASYASLRALIFVRVLGLEKLTNSFGISLMVMGIGSFCGTNIAALLNYYLDNLSISFAFAGLCITTSGILMLCVPRYVEYRKNVDARSAMRRVRFAKVKRRKCCGCI